MFTVAAWIDDRHRSFERHGRTSAVMLMLVDASESLYTEFRQAARLEIGASAGHWPVRAGRSAAEEAAVCAGC